MMKKTFALTASISLLALTIITLSASAHAGKTHSEHKHTNTFSKTIITSFYPLYYFSQQLLKGIEKEEKIELINLAANTPIHDYKPTLKDRIKLDKADLVILFGESLEAWTEDIIHHTPSHRLLVINSSEKDNHKEHDDENHKEHSDEHHKEHSDEHHKEHSDEHHKEHSDEHQKEHSDEHQKEHSDEHHKEHSDEHHKEHSDEHHKEHSDEHHKEHSDEHHKEHSDEHHKEHSDKEHAVHNHNDPHEWLYPIYAQGMVNEIFAKLQSLPYLQAHQALLKKNANELTNKLSQLDQAYKTQLKNCAKDTLLVSHDAFQYLATHYAFKTHSILGLSTHDKPSAYNLRRLIDIIKSNDIRYFLHDESFQYNDYLAIIDPQEKLTSLAFYTLEKTPKPGQDYFSLSQYNLKSIVTARQCQQ